MSAQKQEFLFKIKACEKNKGLLILESHSEHISGNDYNADIGQKTIYGWALNRSAIMETLRQTQKKYGSRALVAAILIGLGLILAGFKPMGKGLVLGTLFSIINFVLMGMALSMRLSPTRGKAFVRALGSIFFRYALLAIPLIVAVKLDSIHIIGVVAGIFMVQIFLLAEQIWHQKSPGDPEA